MAKWCWYWREPLRAPALLAPRPQAGTGNTPAPLLLHTFSLTHLLSFCLPVFTPFPHVLPLVGGRGTPRASFPSNPRVGQSWQIGKGDGIPDVCSDVGSGEWWRTCYGLAISARYTVMSGTPEKILELLLEAMRPDSSAHDPTGRGQRYPACCVTHWMGSVDWARARHPECDITGCWAGPFGQSAGCPHSCALGWGGECCHRARALLVRGPL